MAHIAKAPEFYLVVRHAHMGWLARIQVFNDRDDAEAARTLHESLGRTCMLLDESSGTDFLLGAPYDRAKPASNEADDALD